MYIHWLSFIIRDNATGVVMVVQQSVVPSASCGVTGHLVISAQDHRMQRYPAHVRVTSVPESQISLRVGLCLAISNIFARFRFLIGHNIKVHSSQKKPEISKFHEVSFREKHN